MDGQKIDYDAATKEAEAIISEGLERGGLLHLALAFKAFMDESTDPPACPKCGSENTFDTGFEEIAGEVAEVECSDCFHQFEVNIESKAIMGDIYDSRLEDGWVPDPKHRKTTSGVAL